jgi:hypothetical protein
MRNVVQATSHHRKAIFPMNKILPVFLALIPFAALVGACAVTG